MSKLQQDEKTPQNVMQLHYNIFILRIHRGPIHKFQHWKQCLKPFKAACNEIAAEKGLCRLEFTLQFYLLVEFSLRKYPIEG